MFSELVHSVCTLCHMSTLLHHQRRCLHWCPHDHYCGRQADHRKLLQKKWNIYVYVHTVVATSSTKLVMQQHRRLLHSAALHNIYLTFTSGYILTPRSVNLACSKRWSDQHVPSVTWVPCYITKGGAYTGVHTGITGDDWLTATVTYTYSTGNSIFYIPAWEQLYTYSNSNTFIQYMQPTPYICHVHNLCIWSLHPKLTFTSWDTPIPASVSLTCSLSWTIQCVPCVTWVPCYITKGGACTGVHTTITGAVWLTTRDSYRKCLVDCLLLMLLQLVCSLLNWIGLIQISSNIAV